MKYDENIGGNFVAPTCQKYGLDQSCNVHLTPENVETFLRNNGKIMIAINEGGHYIAVLGMNNNTNPPTYIVCDPIDRNTATKTWKWGDITSQHTMSFFIAPPGKTVQQCLPGGTAVQV
jgi:hypothetical protein